MVPPSNQSIVGVCTQITLLILYYIRSRVVTLFKVTDSLITITDIFDIIVSFKLINFSFQVFLLFVPDLSTSFTPYIVWIIYLVLVCIL
jgi:hypothetical protein